MSQAPALWTKHRALATGIATEWHVPGTGPDDVKQEALIALWEAARTWDKNRGPFRPFARMVVERHLTDLLRTATRAGRQWLNQAARDDQLSLLADNHNPAQGKADLADILERLPSLTDRERRALCDHLNGRHADDNALWRARRKLKAAA